MMLDTVLLYIYQNRIKNSFFPGILLHSSLGPRLLSGYLKGLPLPREVSREDRLKAAELYPGNALHTVGGFETNIRRLLNTRRFKSWYLLLRELDLLPKIDKMMFERLKEYLKDSNVRRVRSPLN